MVSGPTITDRHKARRAVEARMAKAQALWEACVDEGSCARFTGSEAIDDGGEIAPNRGDDR